MLQGFLYGGDYNPEQWIRYPHILEEDIAYMKKARWNVVTIGVFSWSLLEPEEGQYDFTFFDRIVERLTENGIGIILATPTAARPRWMAEKYPEVLRVEKNRHRNLYGRRHNHCYTSLVYREKAAAIDRRLAQRYGDKILMWHISNELSGECHCDLCQQAFREWLKNKYHNDLEELNHAWWARFWSHDVTDWQQIHSPVDNGEPDGVMTGLYGDWRQFVSEQSVDFMKHEIAAVREVCPDVPVTTNFMGPYNVWIDYHYAKNFVDVISWDSYPEWHSQRGNDMEAYSIAFAHDLHRCLKQKPFLLMESAPSLTDWLPANKLKRPGMNKLASLQAVAHGSDSVMYFQWRKGRGGIEKFHGAVMDHDGKPSGRVFEDVRNLGLTLEKLAEITGSRTKAKVAVVYEYTNRWLIENTSGFHNGNRKYKRTCINHYKEFWKRGINVDVIGLNQDLSGYDVLILPMAYSMSQESIAKMEAFVAAGGCVIATYITGYVDEHDLCYLGGYPGEQLKEVFGLTVNEIDSLYESDRNAVQMNGKVYEALDYCELVTPMGAQVLGRYTDDFYKGYPAVLKHSYKEGEAYYIAFRDDGAFLHDFYEQIIEERHLGGMELPKGVTVHTRQGEEGLYLFVENYMEHQVTVRLDGVYEDMETGEKVCGAITVPGFGIKIYK